MAETIVLILALYAGVGVVFGLLFVTLFAGRIDPTAKGMPIQARVMVFFGAAGLWPLMLVKTVTGSQPAP